MKAFEEKSKNLRASVAYFERTRSRVAAQVQGEAVAAAATKSTAR